MDATSTDLTAVTMKFPVFCDMTTCYLVDLVDIYEITRHPIQDYIILYVKAKLFTCTWTKSYSLQVLRKNKQQLSQAQRTYFAFRMCGRDNSIYNFGYDNHKENNIWWCSLKFSVAQIGSGTRSILGLLWSFKALLHEYCSISLTLFQCSAYRDLLQTQCSITY
jgi:hypothetical protein